MSAPRVQTDAGIVEGSRERGFDRFLGIPYAAAPSGARRFRRPEPAPAHDDVLVATQFGPHAPQLPSLMEDFLCEGRVISTSEQDCLSLNVWTPACDAARRPVMAWIHGGGFTSGSADAAWYDGSRFAIDHDVVVVSLNYRLGPLGFTYLGDIGASEFAGSGSLGVQDAAAALRWVATNVAAFGGDPGNVTIFGESAGAMSVGTLLALPEARGLFHKAILQSGAANTVLSVERAAQYRDDLLGRLSGAGRDVASLQAISVQDLLDAYAAVAALHIDEGLISQPVIDGAILDRHPLEAVRDGAAADVPLLIGTNEDEWRLFSFADERYATMDEATLISQLARDLPGDPADAVRTYTKRLGDVSPGQVLAAAKSDSVFRIPAIRLAEAQRRGGGSAWMYLFTWPSSGLGGALGSCHGLELPFVFNTLDSPSAVAFAGDDAPRHLASDMHATWAAFARHGSPDGGALGDWPQYDEGARATMVLSATSRVEKDPLADERSLWDD